MVLVLNTCPATSYITLGEFLMSLTSGFFTTQYQESKQSNPKKWAENLDRHFSLEDIHMAKKAHEKMPNITNYETNAKIKTTMRYHLTPVRMTCITKSTNNK